MSETTKGTEATAPATNEGAEPAGDEQKPKESAKATATERTEPNGEERTEPKGEEQQAEKVKEETKAKTATEETKAKTATKKEPKATTKKEPKGAAAKEDTEATEKPAATATEGTEPNGEERTEAPAEEPAGTEAPAEEPAGTEAPAEEPAGTEAPAEEQQKPEAKASEEPKKVTPKKTSKADPNATTGVEEFNWEEFAADELESSSDQSEFEKMYSDTLSTIAENEVIDGLVISMNKREVVINIGYKSEGVISLSEFRYDPDLKVGDKVEVYVESQEDKKGQLVLSHKKARAMRSWDRVNQALDQDEVIKGYIKCRTKGGMIVDVFGIEAFLPGSQIDVKPIRDYDAYVGKNMEFKVVKINHEFKNVVVSHKALIEEELEQQKKEIIAKLEKGQVLEGTVKNITSYGVFIDLGGVDGLIHITDLSWGRVNHPEEIVELDQKLNVVILDFDDDKKRIALGLKQLTPHPWDSLDEALKVGDQVKGRVVVMADYGAFVEIAAGVEGLIHVSEMSWSQHLRSAQEFMKVGDEVDAVILTLDREERKMSLGIKQLKTDPWEKIEEKYGVGSKHSAKVRNFTNFGVFVEIEEGVDGLIHISDLSWTKKIKHPAEFTAIAADIEVVVLEIDKENRRLSLGHKQLEENPWDVFESVFGVDSIHEGTIIELMDKGAVIALPYGVEGFVTPKHLVKEDGSPVKTDEKLDFKVIEFNKSAKKIILSHSRIHEDEKKSSTRSAKQTEGAEVRKATRKIKTNLERTTLGDISELAALKSEMEESQKSDKKKQTKEPKETKEVKQPKKTEGSKEAKKTQPEPEDQSKAKKEAGDDKEE